MGLTIYSTPTCHFCKEAKQYFTENEIPFEEKNVSGNSELLEHIVALTGTRSVPVIVYGTRHMVGWSKDKFKELIGEPAAAPVDPVDALQCDSSQ